MSLVIEKKIEKHFVCECDGRDFGIAECQQILNMK